MRDDPLAVDSRPPQRIAVLRALQLGDLICAVPALRALRHAYPQATITLIGLPWAADFVRRYSHLVDRFAPFPGFPGLPEREPDLAAFPAFVEAMQRSRQDAVLQLHGRGDLSNPIALLFGARVAAGFHPQGGWCPDAKRFTPWPETGTEVTRLLALTDFLGIARRGVHVEFPVSDEEALAAAEVLASRGLRAGEFVCIHPGARMPSRRWPVERYAKLAALLARAGWQVAVTGTKDEAEICAAVQRGGGAAAVDLCGRTSLGVLGALVSTARLVVCNDTGISHVAAGRRVPSVIVSCGADATRFPPEDRERHRMLFRQTPCRPCMHVDCPIGHPCATELTLDEVARAVFAQLARYATAIETAE